MLCPSGSLPPKENFCYTPFIAFSPTNFFQATRFFPSRSFCRSSLRSNMPARVKNSLACMKNMLKSPCQVMRKTCGYIYICMYIYQSNINTAWKESKYRVFPGPYFRAFGLNTEIYSVNQSECGKICTTKNSIFGHFSRSLHSHYLFKLIEFQRFPAYPACNYMLTIETL